MAQLHIRKIANDIGKERFFGVGGRGWELNQGNSFALHSRSTQETQVCRHLFSSPSEVAMMTSTNKMLRLCDIAH